MKKIDATLMSDLIAEVIAQCKKDISRFLLKGEGLKEARDAIRFIVGQDFEYYLFMMGMPKQDFDLYRQAILKDSVGLAKRRKGIRRNVAE